LPGHHGKRQGQPLEARTNWEPWLPLQVGHAEIAPALQTAALLVLWLVALLVLLLMVTPL